MNAETQMATADGLGASVEAVPVESLDKGARLWSEDRQAVMGTVIANEELEGDVYRLTWRATGETGTRATRLYRDHLLVVVCGS